MTSGQLTATHLARLLLLCLLAGTHFQAAAFDDEDAGWTTHHHVEDEPWRESDGELPPYPQEAGLIEFGTRDAGSAYRIMIDAPSVSVGDDQVVRYTVVIISGAGVWNVSHEGLHCGNKVYRRYAYGVNGQWQELADSPWLPLDSRGMYAYRRAFYLEYMCDPSGPFLQPAQIIRKFRTRKMLIGD